MSFIDGLLHRVHVLTRGERYADELRDELRFHVELDAQSRSRDSGVPHDDARRAFGNATYYREEVRGMTALGWLDRLRQDLGYAWRGLRREPAFTVAVVVTLALGLGVNAAVYSVLDRIFVRAPAGVPDPHGVRRLYVSERVAVTRAGSHVSSAFDFPSYQALRIALPDAVLGAFIGSDSVRVRTADGVGTARIAYSSASYFHVLGLRPLAGRFFAPDEDDVETPAAVVVISDALWDHLFHRSPSAIGRTIDVSGSHLTIIGITPPNFTGTELDRADLWAPLGNWMRGADPSSPWYDGSLNVLHVLIRRSPSAAGVRLLDRGSAALRAQMSEMIGRPDTVTKLLMGPLVQALGPAERDSAATISTRLAGVALIVLLIACANVTNLLLLRASRRQREIAVRRALGVSATRLVGQLVTESMLLAVIAGAAALLVGAWGGSVLRHVLFPTINWAGGTMTTDLIVVCAIGALLVGVIAGLALGFGALRLNTIHGLRDGAQSGRHGSSLVRAGLVIAQAALSVVLLVGAGLFVRSLRNVESIDVGYATKQLLFATPGFSSGAANDTVVAQALPTIAARIGRAPGARSVALTNVLPMDGYRFAPVYLPGRDSALRPDLAPPTYMAVSPNFFSTVGIGVLAGRAFSAADARDGPPVLIVSRAFARAAWSGESAIGKCVMMTKRTNPCRRVIGVVADVHRTDIVEEGSYAYFLPLTQAAALPTSIVVRADPAQLALLTGIVRRAITRALPSADASAVKSMDAELEPQTRPWRLGSELFSALSALAVIVASIGIYSVVAYGVSQRTHEMGVRIALGARTANIVELVVGSGLRIVAVGIVIGIGGALLLARAIQSLLYGVTKSDPVVLVFAGLMLAVLGAVACVIPAWRASRVDPVITLRTE